MSAVTDAIIPAALVLSPVLMELATAAHTPESAATPAMAEPQAAAATAGAAEFTVDEAAFMAPAPPGRMRLASFNMLNLGQGTSKDYDRLARIVNQFDVCSVLELEEEEGLRQLVTALGDGWSSVLGAHEVGKDGHPGTFEHYAFVFRKSKVTPLDSPTGFFPDPDGIFSREPFFSSFRSGHFDFTVAMLHAESPGNAAELTRELEHLPDVISFLQALDPNENDVILTGDFNRSPATPTGKTTQAWLPLLSVPQMDCVIPDAALTTINTNAATGFANHYDEICLGHDNTREFTGPVGAFNFVQAMFEGQNGPAAQLVSDHLPVWAEFRTDMPDDDGTPPSGGGTTTRPADGCCKICKTSKACGNACIARELNCTQPAGCACDG